MLVQKEIKSGENEYAEISTLMLKTFPAEERIPDSMLKFPLTYKAFYDDGKFTGAAVCMQTARIFFVLYLVVKPECRSKGYGGAIMKELLNDAGERPLVLNIEKLDPCSANYAERLRRFAFYRRCGLKDSGFQICGDFCSLAILTAAESINPEDYLKVFREYTNYPPGIIVISPADSEKRRQPSK